MEFSRFAGENEDFKIPKHSFMASLKTPIPNRRKSGNKLNNFFLSIPFNLKKKF
jgi:hypothetical protein